MLKDEEEEWLSSESSIDMDDGDDEFNPSEISSAGEDDDNDESLVDSNDEDDLVDSESDDEPVKKRKKLRKSSKPTIKSNLKKSPHKSISPAQVTPQNSQRQMIFHDTPPANRSAIITPDKSILNSSINSSPEAFKPVEMPEGVVGRGSHEHNFFDFLLPEKRKDSDGKRPDDPDYNHRTLKVPEKFLREQTPAMAQWWEFKSKNMDTVLFFKVISIIYFYYP